jgi:hypothetical protein
LNQQPMLRSRISFSTQSARNGRSLRQGFGTGFCGRSGLMHVRLLLAQHFLAVAADLMLRCSPSRGSGHSVIPTSLDFRPTLRCNLNELTEGGRSGHISTLTPMAASDR